MSELFAKLQAPTEDRGGRATASLKALLKRWGYRFDGPERVIIESMSGVEIWVRKSGRGDSAIFEKQLNEGGLTNAVSTAGP